MLTPEQIQQARKELGLPTQGFGSSSQATTGKSPADKIAERRARVGYSPLVQPSVAPQLPSFTGPSLPSVTNGSTQAIPDASTPSTLGAIQNTGNSLITGTVESGKDIGSAISAPIVQKALNYVDKADQESLGGIIKLRNTAKAQGKDVTHYDNLIKNFQLSNKESITDIFPELKKSNEQVIGDFGSLFLEALGGSSGLTGATKKIAGVSEGLPFAKRALEGAKVGGAYGTGFGITGALQDNQSPLGIAKSAAVGGVTGTVTGAAANAIVGKRPVGAQELKKTSNAIDAVTPDLTGKKLSKAYEDVVKGKRTVTPSSVFREQKLSPGDQIEALGYRLKDVVKSKDPTKNLLSLNKELTTTESKIQDLFRADPELQYNANKPELFDKLENAKSSIPREFKAIKENKSVFDNVFDFGKELLNGTEDTPLGIRTARTAFDNQARLEYPNAFKEGIIDLKTPAGRAIKIVRDLYNEHLYDTAPNGSEIQKLIGHEADILRANENVAQKAAKLNGETKLYQWAKKHPGIVKALGAAGIVGLGGLGLEAKSALAGD